MSEAVLSGNPVLERYWWAVSHAEAVRPGPIGVEVLGRHYVLWRDGEGSLTVLPDRCPHREALLSGGTIVDGDVVCPYHGWRFDPGGRCVVVPSSGPDAPIPPTAHLGPVRVAEKYGLVWLCPGEPVADIPVVPQDEDPAYRRLNPPTQLWQVSVTRMVDNFVDISHFPFVHQETFGPDPQTPVPRIEMVELDNGFVGYEYEVEARNQDAGRVVSELETPTVTRRMSTGFLLPTTVRGSIRYETGLEHVLLLLSTPVDDVTSLFTFVVWRNDDFSVPAEQVLEFDLQVGAEDQRMLETVSGMLPMDPTATVNVQADRCSVEWRRRFAALLAGS